MSNAQDIKRRIKSVKSTQQITKAMKIVSATKLRKTQGKVLAVRPYAQKMHEVISHLAGDESQHPYLLQREIKKIGYVIIASDGGLCGGFNSNLLRYADGILKETALPYGIIAVGSKTRDYFTHRNRTIDQIIPSISENPDFNQSKDLAKTIIDSYLDGTYDEIYLIYTNFKSAMSQQPTHLRLLPVEKAEVEENTFSEYIFEPDKNEILSVILPQYIEVSVYRTLLEAKTSEHGARMTAMSSATENALEMIEKLTLSLNRARQAAITTEISEIVGGAAALSN